MQLAPNHIRIVIADDHEMFRDGFKLTLSSQQDIHLVGEAANGSELVNLVDTQLPDLVITDIKMPLMDGVEAAKIISDRFPDMGIIGLSMYEEEDLIIDMLEAGARGYLLKNASKHQILEAIHTVYNGNPYYCNTTSNTLTQMIAKSKFNPYRKREKIAFTEREKEIIELICQELTNKEIGDKLFISSRTVEGHRLKIMEKMDVKNPVGLAVYALKHGLCKM